MFKYKKNIWGCPISKKSCHFDEAKQGEIYYNQCFKISRSDESKLAMTKQYF